jgi:LPXTG-site transpeptidase (sortase) family protein
LAPIDTPKVRARRSWKRKLLYLFLALVLFALIVIGSVIGYFVIQEYRSPSGKVFVETTNGKVELNPVQTVVAPPTAAATGLDLTNPTPPTELKIGSIGLDTQTYLMSADVPKTPVAGWLYGSAMPGTKGNTVFYGARAGAAAVFQKIGQLKSGDQIVVRGGEVGYVYQVASIQEVASNDTALLLPTDKSVVTLITDAGQWDDSLGGYTKRLVVRANYVTAKSWEGK